MAKSRIPEFADPFSSSLYSRRAGGASARPWFASAMKWRNEDGENGKDDERGHCMPGLQPTGPVKENGAPTLARPTREVNRLDNLCRELMICPLPRASEMSA